jgi:hypothetical protein
MKTGDLLAKVEAIRGNAKKREPVQLPATPTALAKVVQLPLWPEPVRGVPNSVLRSALFGAIKRGRRSYLQGEPVAAVDGVTILFTGPRLDQADLDVWEQCLHLARTGGLGCRIQFAAHGFLKSIGKNTSGANHEWLKNAFRRLSSSVVEIKEGKRAYFGPMIHHGTRDDETGHYSIEINPAIVRLYGSDGWSQVEWEQRQALKRQPLAQWLHGFYTTHAAPFPMRVETIHRLSGSENQQIAGFRRELREALDKLAVATGWTWEIDLADLVHISKKPTPSQGRHLIRKKLNGT